MIKSVCFIIGEKINKIFDQKKVQLTPINTLELFLQNILLIFVCAHEKNHFVSFQGSYTTIC